MENKITIVNQKQEEEDVELVTYLNTKDNKNQYIVYTRNEKQPNGDIVIYISKLIEENKIKKIVEIKDEEEWKNVQTLLKEIANA
ncbi:MAG: DUF1292 domain-containing protein [Bacilli bacterium]|nr:DUF1292 domain-containing protein [Bacilli bacterium]